MKDGKKTIAQAMENLKVKEIIKNAKVKNLIKPHTAAFEEVPTKEEAHEGNAKYFYN